MQAEHATTIHTSRKTKNSGRVTHYATCRACGHVGPSRATRERAQRDADKHEVDQGRQAMPYGHTHPRTRITGKHGGEVRTETLIRGLTRIEAFRYTTFFLAKVHLDPTSRHGGNVVCEYFGYVKARGGEFQIRGCKFFREAVREHLAEAREIIRTNHGEPIGEVVR